MLLNFDTRIFLSKKVLIYNFLEDFEQYICFQIAQKNCHINIEKQILCKVLIIEAKFIINLSFYIKEIDAKYFSKLLSFKDQQLSL